MVEPASGFPGDTIVATGAPFSEAYDTLILVGGFRATVVDVDREQCTKCDTCRDEAGCGGCKSDCADCEETVEFTLPAATAGETTLTILNQFGGSEAIPFTMLGVDTGADTAADTSDTAADTGETADTGQADTSTDTSADTATDTAN